MEIKNMSKEMYYYNFEIYNIEEALKNSKNINLQFSKYETISDKDKKVMCRYQKDFETLCNKLINKDLSTIEEYVQTTDALIVVNAKTQQFINNLQNKYTLYDFKEINKLQIINENLVGAESWKDLFFDAHASKIAISVCLFASIFLFYVGVTRIDLTCCFVACVLAIIQIIVAIFGRKVIRTSMKIDRLNRNIANHTYLKSLKMKQIYRYSQKLIEKSIK